ncbi:MAG: GH3 family domain-containing protein, partial [Flavobacteriaceae bacterium]
MPLPLFHSIASWILKKRIHQIELFMKFPNEVQEELRYHLISKAKYTEVGKRYGFESIESYNDFKNKIPLSNYESISEAIERCRKGTQNIFWPSPIKWFAKSSGTTQAKSKFIPVSTEALEDCHYKAGKDMLSLYFNNNEHSQLLSGKCLRLGGSHELYNENNSSFGDLSAIIIQNLPFWAELSSTPSHKTSLIAEWETKMKAIITETLPEKVTSLAGIPSWMLILLQNVLRETGKTTVNEVWPDAEVYFHGGVSFKPYRDLYHSLFPKPGFQFYEIY